MPKSARLTDITVGICVCHPCPTVGVIITGSPNMYVNNLKKARLTDLVLGLCGHIGFICTGSSDTYINNLRSARIGDTTSGCIVTTIVTGSPNVFVNDKG